MPGGWAALPPTLGVLAMSFATRSPLALAVAAATALAGEADDLRVQVDGFLKQVASA